MFPFRSLRAMSALTTRVARVERSRREVAGVPAAQVSYARRKVGRETVVGFARGNVGFMVYAIEGTEEDNVAAVFDEILSTFTFLP